jgi:hypothetical protein
VLIGAFVVWGAADLAREDKKYCAPISVKEARRTGSHFQLTVLSKADFARPEVSAMVKSGRVFSVANYLGNPDYYLVGVLDRFGPRRGGEVPPVLFAFGLLSFSATAAVLLYSLRSAVRR